MLIHKGTITLETERLILRKFEEADADDMFHNWGNDEEVAKYMRWNVFKSVDETRNNIKQIIRSYDNPKTYRWAIVLKNENKAVGSIGLQAADDYDKIADVAYTLGRAFWNKGIVSEALRAVIKFGLLEIGLNRIEAYHAVRNPASGKVMQKCGMQYEGMARQKYRSHLGFEDCHMYAILKEDMKA